MTARYETPQDAEDAFYDAIDECDLERMMGVWEASPEVVCAIPMQPLRIGFEAVRDAWSRVLVPQVRVEIAVRHLHWVEQGEMAIHTVEETVTVLSQPRPQPPIYGFNVYRRGGDGWRMILHTNSPTPPPPGIRPPF